MGSCHYITIIIVFFHDALTTGSITSHGSGNEPALRPLPKKQESGPKRAAEIEPTLTIAQAYTGSLLKCMFLHVYRFLTMMITIIQLSPLSMNLQSFLVLKLSY